MDELEDQAFYGSFRQQTVYRCQRFSIHDRVLSGPRPHPRPDIPRRKAQLGVALVRENHFKAVNDTLGHATGDAVLAAFGARLTAWAGPRAAVGRIGGDEFAVVLDLPPARRRLRLEHLVRMLHTPVVLDDGRTVDVAASIGAATPDVLGTRDLTALQRMADAALYDGKHTGRAVLATAQHATVPSINGRRIGRPGTATWGRAA
ncbi:GGDEF domain-containing protein [Streptomyces sp. NPDC088180]|uniref:GGDEF domain-containing protein n=1 Tax=Streptomyces sp. NPDC088180 TaxID=3365837 RepID=UPI00381448F8